MSSWSEPRPSRDQANAHAAHEHAGRRPTVSTKRQSRTAPGRAGEMGLAAGRGRLLSVGGGHRAEQRCRPRRASWLRSKARPQLDDGQGPAQQPGGWPANHEGCSRLSMTCRSRHHSDPVTRAAMKHAHAYPALARTLATRQKKIAASAKQPAKVSDPLQGTMSMAGIRPAQAVDVAPTTK